MQLPIVVIILFILLLIFILMKVPIGYSMAVTGVLYFFINNVPMDTMIQKA